MHLSKIWPLGGGGVVHTELKFIHGIAKNRGGVTQEVGAGFFIHPHLLSPNMYGFTRPGGRGGVELIKPPSRFYISRYDLPR